MSKAWRPARKETMRDEALKVGEPKGWTEFEIQAVVWGGLRKLGINARGEVKTTFSGRAKVRFDVAVFDGDKLAGVIEIKREGKQLGSDWSATRQGQRYSQFFVPVRLVKGMQEAEGLLRDAALGHLWVAASSG
jgi:hypothetical protein